MVKNKPRSGRKGQKQAQERSHFKPFSDANTEPVGSRGSKQQLDDEDDRDGARGAPPNFLSGNLLADFTLEDPRPKHPPLLLPLHNLINRLPASEAEKSQTVSNSNNVATVTNGPLPKVQDMMNANGTHPPHRHHQPHLQRDKRNHVNDVSVTGINITSGPMRSYIQVAKPYVFQQSIEGCLHDLGVTQDREDNIRLAGVRWIDSTRKALKLPVRTYDTAVVYYHKFRLSHADNEYSFMDAAAAALFAACKIEDTLKKSRDILCAAHNDKIPSRADHLSSDDPRFEHHARNIIGVERLMLEASSFDFRNRHPQQLIVKLAKYYGYEKHSAITRTAYQISLDLYRTFGPLKQSTAAMAFACLELAGRLHGQEKEAIVDGRDYTRWNIERAMVMETLLDLLELYTNYRTSTTVGNEFPIDTFLEIRIPLNDELHTRQLPRYTEYVPRTKTDPAGYAINATNGVLPSLNGVSMSPGMNGRVKASPTSPATPTTPGVAVPGPGIRQKAGERGKDGTIRFMLNPDRQQEEKGIVALYAPLLASMKR